MHFIYHHMCNLKHTHTDSWVQRAARRWWAAAAAEQASGGCLVGSGLSQLLQHRQSRVQGRQGLLSFQVPGGPGAVRLHRQATLLQQAIGDGQSLSPQGGEELGLDREGDVPGVLEVGLQDAPYLEETVSDVKVSL